ncbi:hypothetical protein BV22DRAFT_1037546 [Leucogyrophana mollusca]|uniref:Uncharacterized protein n=1 Tax=Leucogyrophana mollusca TaxID=85980 RepID=A0ACB8BC29_9AGAM|nr:hypothetical protein BV22DRAFT_1037546 [Leucogyrophana mollusca]
MDAISRAERLDGLGQVLALDIHLILSSSSSVNAYLQRGRQALGPPFVVSQLSRSSRFKLGRLLGNNRDSLRTNNCISSLATFLLNHNDHIPSHSIYGLRGLKEASGHPRTTTASVKSPRKFNLLNIQIPDHSWVQQARTDLHLRSISQVHKPVPMLCCLRTLILSHAFLFSSSQGAPLAWC